MRLFLSSYRFGNHPKKFADLLHGQERIGIITNAQDVYTDPEIRSQKLAETIEQLQDIGLRGEELDLRDYFYHADELAKRLTAYDGLWVCGGNSFVLRKAMRYSGFDEIIKELLRVDTIVYGGFSAGACVVGKDMHGLELCDEASATPAGYKQQTLWDGLNLVPYTIVPHYQSDHPETLLIDEVVSYLDQHILPYKTLHDGEVIIIDGNKEALVG